MSEFPAAPRSQQSMRDGSSSVMFSLTTSLLASDKWQKTDPFMHANLIKRLKLIVDAGLPPMQLIPLSVLEQLGRIPRSDENLQVDAVEAVTRCGADSFGKSKAVLLFFSHRWLRPNWCEAHGKDVKWGTDEWSELSSLHGIGAPDNAEHDKAHALIQWCKWFRRVQASGIARGVVSSRTGNGLCYPSRLGPHTFQMSTSPDIEIFLWIDWCSIDQKNKQPGIAALPAYVGACQAIVAMWNDEYASRAWCRTELMTAQAFMPAGHAVFVLEDGFVDRDGLSTRVLEEHVRLLDPANGALTGEADRADIYALREIAGRSQAFTCWRVFVGKWEAAPLGYPALLCICFCGLGGLIELNTLARDPRPGKGRITKIVPRDRDAPCTDGFYWWPRGAGRATAGKPPPTLTTTVEGAPVVVVVPNEMVRS